MNRTILTLFSLFVVIASYGQNQLSRFDVSYDKQTSRSQDTINRMNEGVGMGKNPEATIDLYKIISVENDTTIVDTTLTIYKDYKYNYLRKDYFDLLPFNNIGQTFNSLSYNFSSNKLMPVFGSRARHFNFMEIEDTYYYNVPTPLTELMFKTAFEQGQLLDAFFTVNTSEQFNLSIAYKGLRSLGKYQHILTSTGNFRFTTNYKTKSNRYNLRAHVVIQDLMNQENGGLLDEDLIDFENGNPRFIDRSVFDPAFENAESILKGERFHIDQYYNIVQQKDSISHNIWSVGSILSYEDKSYQYDQSSPYSGLEGYGDSFTTSNLKDKVTLETVYAEANTKLSNKTIGDVKFNLGYQQFNYGYNKVVSIDGNYIGNRLKGNVISVGGEYKNKIGQFLVHGKLGVNISGDFNGNYLDGKASYQFRDSSYVQAKLNINSKAPNYNYLLYQSDYINYNWQNSFDNVRTKQLGFELNSKKFFNAQVDYTTIDNHTYFSQSAADNNLVKPNQFSGTINYFRIKLEKEFKRGKFALNNTVRYQKVIDGEGVLNVPEFVTRNTLYYSNHFFKKALFLQTGIIFNYFTEYNTNAYDPVLAEFYVQNENKIGGFPRLDFFINAKVRQTRIFLKAEHFNSSFTGYNFYSAPNYPYRDFAIRFGIVWNFFM
jgi:hypothetical protein